MAKAKKKAKNASAASRARASKAMHKSVQDVKKATRNLELKLKKHKQVMSAMFFVPGAEPPNHGF
jgi:hypothetical protein